MIATQDRLFKKHLLEQALAYLVTGVLLSISHHLHNYASIIIFGHLLIAVAFLILISATLNHNWMRRIASPLDIFSGTTLIITFVMDIIIFIVDELTFYTQFKTLTQNLIDSLFVTILATVLIWVCLLCLQFILPVFKPKLSIRVRLPYFVFLIAVVLILVDYFTNVIPLQYVLLLVMGITVVYFLVLQNKRLRKWRLVLLDSCHIFLVLAIVFLGGGILSTFTNAISSIWFWRLGFFSICVFIISVLLLRKLRVILFRLIHRFFISVIRRMGLMKLKIGDRVTIKAQQTLLFQYSYRLVKASGIVLYNHGDNVCIKIEKADGEGKIHVGSCMFFKADNLSKL